MIPTLAAVKKAFNFYNRKYFENKLPTPAFSMNCPSNMWACFIPDGQIRTRFGKVIRFGWPCGTLCVTSKYSRNEKDILNSIIHEMVHMYVLFVLRKNPLNPHGIDFMRKANEINRDGWYIANKNDMKDTDIANNGKIKSSMWSDNSLQENKTLVIKINEAKLKEIVTDAVSKIINEIKG